MICRAIPYKGSEPFIFLSYSHADSEILYPLFEQMAADGYRIWYDDDNQGGDDWLDNIENHLEECSLCIAFMSENSSLSHNCKSELVYAIKCKKKVVPILIEMTDLPKGLRMQLSYLHYLVRENYASDRELLDKIYLTPECAACKSSSEGKARLRSAEPEEKKSSDSPFSGFFANLFSAAPKEKPAPGKPSDEKTLPISNPPKKHHVVTDSSVGEKSSSGSSQDPETQVLKNAGDWEEKKQPSPTPVKPASPSGNSGFHFQRVSMDGCLSVQPKTVPAASAKPAVDYSQTFHFTPVRQDGTPIEPAFRNSGGNTFTVTPVNMKSVTPVSTPSAVPDSPSFSPAVAQSVFEPAVNRTQLPVEEETPASGYPTAIAETVECGAGETDVLTPAPEEAAGQTTVLTASIEESAGETTLLSVPDADQTAPLAPPDTDATTLLSPSDAGETTLLDSTRNSTEGGLTVKLSNRNFALLVQLAQHRAHTLRKPQVKLGRSPIRCDIAIQGNDSISKYHADIFQYEGKSYLCDAGSANGTFLNGEPLTSGIQTELDNPAIFHLSDETLIWISGALAQKFINQKSIHFVMNEEGTAIRLMESETLSLNRNNKWPDGTLADSWIHRAAHALLRKNPDGVYLIDESPSQGNGTYLNGVLLNHGDTLRLSSGDRIRLGDTTLIFETIEL